MIKELNKSKNLEMNMRKYTVKISIVWSLGIIIIPIHKFWIEIESIRRWNE